MASLTRPLASAAHAFGGDVTTRTVLVGNEPGQTLGSAPATANRDLVTRRADHSPVDRLISFHAS